MGYSFSQSSLRVLGPDLAAGTQMGQTWGLSRRGSQVKGEQTRLTYLMALPVRDLEVQERKFCNKVCVLCSSGWGGLELCVKLGLLVYVCSDLMCPRRNVV